MILTKDKKILIVGLGLMGGSYAMALKKKGYHVSAITKEQGDIEFALKNRMIDEGCAGVDSRLIKEADVIIFALYPTVLIEWLGDYGHLIKAGTVITDVTGVKGCIVDKIQSMLPGGIEFIAAHPMAGRESYGVENSTDTIFKEANYIVVPTEKNTPDAIRLCKELGGQLGFRRIAQLSVAEHDKMIAFLSQLTHCIAVSLMCTSDNPNIREYTGDSFRDLTRIAKINENMWSELFILNKEALLCEIDAFMGQIQKLRGMIETEDVDGMKQMMICSTERRKTFDRK